MGGKTLSIFFSRYYCWVCAKVVRNHHNFKQNLGVSHVGLNASPRRFVVGIDPSRPNFVHRREVVHAAQPEVRGEAGT